MDFESWKERAEPEFTDEHRAAVRGELDQDTFDRIEWWRLTAYCRRVMNNYLPVDVEWNLHQDAVDGRLNLNLDPFTADGWLTVRWGDAPLTVLHVSLLMPGAPLDIAPINR